MKLRLLVWTLGACLFVHAQSGGEHWVATWTTAQMLARIPTPRLRP